MTTTTAQLLDLDLEYRLTIAVRISCPCAPYLARRAGVLLPEVLRTARDRNQDPVDVFAAFAARLHDRHEEGADLT